MIYTSPSHTDTHSQSPSHCMRVGIQRLQGLRKKGCISARLGGDLERGRNALTGPEIFYRAIMLYKKKKRRKIKGQGPQYRFWGHFLANVVYNQLRLPQNSAADALLHPSIFQVHFHLQLTSRLTLAAIFFSLFATNSFCVFYCIIWPREQDKFTAKLELAGCSWPWLAISVRSSKVSINYCNGFV